MKNNNFFQPIISVIGLAVSLITAILPIFKLNAISNLFIIQDLVQPISFLSFIISFATIWLVLETPYLEITIGKLRDRGRGFVEPLKRITVNGIVCLLLIMNSLFSISFLTIKIIDSEKYYLFLGSIQALLFLLFFIVLSSVFAILFAQTKRKYDWQEDRDNFPQTVFQTLERNHLVKPWIEIYENRDITPDEAVAEGLQPVPFLKRMKVKTTNQKEEVIEFLVSSDGKNLIKIIKKTE